MGLPGCESGGPVGLRGGLFMGPFEMGRTRCTASLMRGLRRGVRGPV